MMLKLKLRILLYLLICTLLTGCGKGNGSEPPVDKTKQRTVLMYMGADGSDLSPDSYGKLKAIVDGWGEEIKGNFIIFQDTPSQRGPRLIEVTGEGESGYNEKYYGNTINSADPDEFRKVINEVITTFPAESYGLIVYSHGSGWLPEGTVAARSIVTDGKDEMEIRDFAQAIPNNTFDFIIFEACNMAGVEVVYELKDKADYIVASVVPVVSPGFEELYTDNLSYLFEKEANLEAFAQSYYNLWNNKTGARRSATISIFDTAEIQALANVIKEIEQADIDPYIIQNFDGEVKKPFYFFDLKQYYDLLATDTQRQQLNTCLNKLVTYKANTPNHSTGNGVFPITTNCGITTYIEQNDLPELNSAYKQLQWYKAISK